MSDIKTVTHEGQVYEIGGVYEFSDGGRDWALGELLYIDEGKSLPFCTREYEWELIREASYSMGTITPAPIVFDHGKAYTFDYGDWKHVIGLYSKNIRCFIALNEDDNTYLASGCKNIRLMTVESK